MKRSPIKLGIVLLAAVIGAIFLNKYFVKNQLGFYPKSFVNFGSYLFAEAENFGGNDKLKQDQEMIGSLRAKIDDLENENDFLRRAIHVSQKFDHTIVYAGVFNLNLAPAGYNMLLNKGVEDGISEGDVVVTAEGVLVGNIQKVMQNFSRVLFVSDPEFKITAKVVGSETSGIARGALNEGIYLDFVVQEDEIKEKDMLISTGSDMFPPALVIGSVDYVESNTTQMLKKVRIRPAVKDAKLGRVLVIKMK